LRPFSFFLLAPPILNSVHPTTHAPYDVHATTRLFVTPCENWHTESENDSMRL